MFADMDTFGRIKLRTFSESPGGLSRRGNVA
jgi:hypothetical protein